MLGIAAVVAVVVFLAAVATAAPPQPILDVTVTAHSHEHCQGFIYTAGENLITRNRMYHGTVEDIDRDGKGETIVIIEDSVCKRPCSLVGMEGRNSGVFIIYLSGGKVVEGRFEGRLMDGGLLSGSWQITRVAERLGDPLTHGHGSGTYTGQITGDGSFYLELVGSIDL